MTRLIPTVDSVTKLPPQSEIDALSAAIGGGAGGAVSSVAGRTGTVVLTKSDVGLSNVDNTADAGKPVSTAQAAADAAVVTSSAQRASNLSDLASAATARTNLGLGSAATFASTAFDAAGSAAAVTPIALGLGNVNNTADSTKPVSAAQLTAINLYRRATLATMPGMMAPAGARLSWYRNTQVTNLIGGTNVLFIPIPDATQETFLPVFANLFGEEIVGANPITIACSIQASNGTRMPYTFGGGNHTAVIQPGGVVTPDNPISTPQVSASYSAGAGSGTVSGVWIWVYVAVASGQAIPLNVAVPLSGAEVDGLSTTGGPDRTLTGSGSAVAGNNANGWTFGPVAMLGTSKSIRIFGAIGDSILQGQGDTPNYIGYMNRAAIASQTPILNVAVAGERALDFAPSNNRSRRTAELNGITDLFINLGVNDLNTGQSVSQLQANLTIIYGWATNLGIRVHALTVTPLTTSTDAWATTGNQTSVISPATLSSINSWLRTLPAGIYACHDVATVVSTSQDSGIWKAGYTSDGIHPNASSHQGALATDLASYISTYKASGAWQQ